jgi:hypothetical protein
MLDVDALAQEIRRVDGSNSLGAGALAEALMPFIAKQQADMARALEPFAYIADVEDQVGRDDPEDDRIWVVQAHGCQLDELTIGDFRAARDALEKHYSSLKLRSAAHQENERQHNG